MRGDKNEEINKKIEGVVGWRMGSQGSRCEAPPVSEQAGSEQMVLSAITAVPEIRWCVRVCLCVSGHETDWGAGGGIEGSSHLPGLSEQRECQSENTGETRPPLRRLDKRPNHLFMNAGKQTAAFMFFFSFFLLSGVTAGSL